MAIQSEWNEGIVFAPERAKHSGELTPASISGQRPKRLYSPPNMTKEIWAFRIELLHTSCDGRQEGSVPNTNAPEFQDYRPTRPVVSRRAPRWRARWAKAWLTKPCMIRSFCGPDIDP